MQGFPALTAQYDHFFRRGRWTAYGHNVSVNSDSLELNVTYLAIIEADGYPGQCGYVH